MQRIWEEPTSDESTASESDDEIGDVSPEGGSGQLIRRSCSEPRDLRYLPQNLLPLTHAASHPPHASPLHSRESAVSPSGHIEALTDDIGGKILAGKWPLARESSEDSRSSSNWDPTPVSSPPGVQRFFVGHPHHKQSPIASKVGGEQSICAKCKKLLDQAEPAYLHRQQTIGQVRVFCKSCHEGETNLEAQQRLLTTHSGPPRLASPFEVANTGSALRDRPASPVIWHMEHERQRLMGSVQPRLPSGVLHHEQPSPHNNN